MASTSRDGPASAAAVNGAKGNGNTRYGCLTREYPEDQGFADPVVLFKQESGRVYFNYRQHHDGDLGERHRAFDEITLLARRLKLDFDVAYKHLRDTFDRSQRVIVAEDDDDAGGNKLPPDLQPSIDAVHARDRVPPLSDDWDTDKDTRGVETVTKPPPLAWLDMSSWDSEPVPERKWAIKDRVPLNQAGLFSGEGGTGKSIIELTKDVAHVTGKDWFGSLPETGPAFYVGAEDEADELYRRLADIARHYGLTFSELIKGGLHVLCKLGQDATLCVVGRSGKVETTDFYKQLYQAAGDIKPKNISIDTLSRAFAGNEIDRVQVYAFAMHMQALAMVAGGSVTVLSHPSQQGITSGSGYSGSTAWHGAFRVSQGRQTKRG
jgi:hypothetical protein